MAFDFATFNFNPPTPSGVGLAEFRNQGNSPYFNPPTPSGVGRAVLVVSLEMSEISIHPPQAGWDPFCTMLCVATTISIHPPQAGWDGVPPNSKQPITPFQSTHPKRGGTIWRHCKPSLIVYFNPPTPSGVGHLQLIHVHTSQGFQSTHPKRGGTPAPDRRGLLGSISIHPPQAGWDAMAAEIAAMIAISIHPPQAGWDGS